MKKRKKKISIMIFCMLFTALDIWSTFYCDTYIAKAVTFNEINNPEVFLKQKNGDQQCTLVAATMLVRRAAMMSGYPDWADITIEKVKAQAWWDGKGLRYTFTYGEFTVNRAAFGSDPENEATSLLTLHPEGIVLYDQKRSPRSHAILLTDYTDGIFYSADPADAVPTGRIPNDSALVQVKDGEIYWYVSSPPITLSAPSISEEESQITTTNINEYATSLSQTVFYYDGTEKNPSVTIPGLTENVDYIVSYVNNEKPGTAVVILTGIGAYSGTVTKNFEIWDSSVFDSMNGITVSMTKSLNQGKKASIKTTLPDTLIRVKEFSSSLSESYNEVKISYKSENKKIATVNSSGKITGIKKGTAKIFVTVELADGTKKIFPLKIKVK